MRNQMQRREFLGYAVAVLFAGQGVRSDQRLPGRATTPMPHPDPRPGIDGSKVLTREQLADFPNAVSAFDQVREIPQVVDGIRCSCGCASREGFYSLLSCYEGEGMARHCEVCQGTGRLAYRLHRQGKTLQEIRDAVDVRFK
jgi:hypothetical protein